MLVTLVGIWGVQTVSVYVLGLRLRLGLPGVWLAILLDNDLCALMLGWRYCAGRRVKAVLEAPSR
ncbi:hypothetical protein Dcar01_01017 [Deinococcus carri]|uniref:MATE efflux family protein n=1 Tax=Deinococcus carri TaxID=1211323 RepID=A0ABP9W8H1_9DEIO